MSHVGVALALCAALMVYPGGVSAAVGLGLIQIGWPGPSGLEGLRRRIRAAALNHTWLGAGLLCGLVMLPLPWGGSPSFHLDAGGSSGIGVGGVAVSLLALWVLESWARAPRGLPGATLLGLSWSLGLVGLAAALRAPTWAGVMSAGGLGAEMVRLGLGLTSLVGVSWVAVGHPRRGIATTAAGAARLAISLSLLLPQLQTLPAWSVLAIWWGSCGLLGLAGAGAGSGRKLLRRLGIVPGGALTGRM
ncbi:MAG TPA: hypothetical protein VMV23_10555 [Candidatus Nanopelagicaceae bacterium]|nr:hypothetical protein [Candidatus Nanopelagicaceae bacterium]